ncbi:DUF4232 domain-containing protein [Streptomyces sp. NPDC001500]
MLGPARRGAVAAAVVVSAALAMTACQPTDSPSPAGSSAPVTSPAGGSSAGSPASAGASASTGSANGGSSGGSASSAPATASAPAPGTPPASAPASASASASGGSTGGVVAACAAKSLKVTARQADQRPAGTGTGAAIVTFTNVSARACVLKGHPSVAGAGNGSPEHDSPLAVTPVGPAVPVTVAPGGRAWVKLTFVQVQGEADGYCVSGADPSVYPTIVVGLPGSGAHQVALDDGRFAECDDTVTVTAVAAARP